MAVFLINSHIFSTVHSLLINELSTIEWLSKRTEVNRIEIPIERRNCAGLVIYLLALSSSSFETHCIVHYLTSYFRIMPLVDTTLGPAYLS